MASTALFFLLPANGAPCSWAWRRHVCRMRDRIENNFSACHDDVCFNGQLGCSQKRMLLIEVYDRQANNQQPRHGLLDTNRWSAVSIGCGVTKRGFLPLWCNTQLQCHTALSVAGARTKIKSNPMFLCPCRRTIQCQSLSNHSSTVTAFGMGESREGPRRP